MRVSWLVTIPTVFGLAIQKRDADFDQVRTKMNKDLSGRRSDPNGKYFHESVFHPHYDGRFADRQLSYQQRRHALSNLMQTYLSTMADLGVETWLMHGTLLGWWWNRKIMPWDSDSDVQVSESSMHYMAAYYNMSVFHYSTPRIPDGRDYMLEINPHYINREQTDKMNVIDARWIDTTSGLFIDITTARYNLSHPAGPGMISCKDGHEYRDTYIFPLRDTYFEGVPAKIPFAYKELLEAEYRPKALTNTDFEGHHFDDSKLEWIPIKKQVEPPKPAPPVQVAKPVQPAQPIKPNLAPQPNPNAQPQTPQNVQRPAAPPANAPSQQQPVAQAAQPVNHVQQANPVVQATPPQQAIQNPPGVVVPASTAPQAIPAPAVVPAQAPIQPASQPNQAVPGTPKPAPAPPPAQLKLEDKILKLEAKRAASITNGYNKRRSAELKSIKKEEKKLEKLAKEEEKKIAKEKAAEAKKNAEAAAAAAKAGEQKPGEEKKVEIKIVDVQSTVNQGNADPPKL